MTKLLMHLKLRNLFSNQLAVGQIIRNNEKYRTEAIWPIIMNGCSTGIPPIQVKIITSATKVQNRNWERGRNVSPCCFDVCSKGTTINTKIENKSANTPPSLLGIDRRMA